MRCFVFRSKRKVMCIHEINWRPNRFFFHTCMLPTTVHKSFRLTPSYIEIRWSYSSCGCHLEWVWVQKLIRCQWLLSERFKFSDSWEILLTDRWTPTNRLLPLFHCWRAIKELVNGHYVNSAYTVVQCLKSKFEVRWPKKCPQSNKPNSKISDSKSIKMQL